MPMDELIRAIERADAENIQDVMQAAMERFRALYPQWKMLFLSADTNAADETSKMILDLIAQAEEHIQGNS